MLFIVTLGLAIVLFAQTSTSIPFISRHIASVSAADQTIPYVVNFQGRLTDQNGNIMGNGSYNIKFSLWTAATGGTNVWEEDYLVANSQGVTITSGLFSVELGSITALSPILFATHQNLYLQVELPSPATATTTSPSWTEGAMSPRQPLAAAPYAFNADTIDGIDSSQLARTDQGNTFTGDNTFSGKLTVNSSSGLDVTAGPTDLQGLTASGNVTIQGGSAALGTTTQAGSLALYGGSSNTGTLQTVALSANQTYTLPDASGTVCLTSGNCVGQGNPNNSIGGSGTVGTIPLFNGTGYTIGDSILTQTGTSKIGLTGTLQASTVDANTLQTNGTARIDSSGNLESIDTIQASGSETLGGSLTVQGTGTSSFAGDLTVQGDSDTTGNSQIGGALTINGALPSYQVGDTGPGGGTIFYIDTSTTPATYYEFAPSGWDGTSDPTAEWCNGYTGAAIETGDSTSVTDTGNQAIGAGSSNTATMLANANCTSGAAHLASSYTSGGYSDWFLPSAAELTEMYDYYSGHSDAGGFTSSNYWSSSEYSSTSAWGVVFYNGYQGNLNKPASYYVRPIRSFQVSPYALSIQGSGDFTGTVSVADLQASSATLGSSNQIGSLLLNDGFGHTAAIEVASGGLSQDTTYLLPVVSAASVTICTTAGNCIPNGNNQGDMLYWNGTKWDLVSDGTSNDTLKFCNGRPTWSSDPDCPYTVGQTGPGGGVVFYDKGSYSDGWRYLEAAPSDWDGTSDPTAEWCNGYTSSDIETGDSTSVTDTGNQAIGAGSSNTATMLANANCTAGAAHLASSYTGGGYSDWFLPSLAELDQLYTYWNANGDPGGFTSSAYRSSSESQSGYDWAVSFNGGVQYGSSNANQDCVRPIRAF